MINFFYKRKSLFDIAPRSFVPTPKGTSSLIHIAPNEKPIVDVEMDISNKVVATAFSQRRKILRSSLKALEINVDDLLIKSNIEPTLRAEQLSLEDFAKIAQNFAVK
jgi:16S rRNA (adenine1518-N6/adenine1519-N6)-dimethyltransferase